MRNFKEIKRWNFEGFEIDFKGLIADLKCRIFDP